MDLKSIINKEDDGEPKRHSTKHASTPSQIAQSPQSARSAYSSEFPFPQHGAGLHSGSHDFRPSASPTAYFQANPHAITPTSPGPQSIATPGAYQTTYRLPSYPSLSRSPSLNQGTTVHPFPESPVSTYSYPRHASTHTPATPTVPIPHQAGYPEAQAFNAYNRASPNVPSPYQERRSVPNTSIPNNGIIRQRDRSISVSPKTVIGTIPARQASEDHNISPAHHLSTLGDPDTHPQKPAQASPFPKSHASQHEITPTHEPQIEHDLRRPTSDSKSPSASMSLFQEPISNKENHNIDLVLSTRVSNPTGLTRTSTSSMGLKRNASDHATNQRPIKRPRIKDPPIWAMPAKNLKPLKISEIPTNINQGVSKAINGRPKSVEPAVDSISRGNDELLGPWEPTFTNVIPQDDRTKAICDFLYHDVISHDLSPDEGAGGQPEKGQLEIEAKLGRIIDRNTNERLALPSQTEMIVSENFNVAFESFMSVSQHKDFNDMLNKATQDSLGMSSPEPGRPSKKRIGIEYVHKYETDTFYELGPAEVSTLPSGIRDLILEHQGPRPKIRVTRDQKTGQVLAKIIKARVKDLHVYSPKTLFDWRVSVNIEYNWEGDLSALDSVRARSPDRHKDRVSYKHLAFQIDLTQVKGERQTHELEVEISGDEIRKQGRLLRQGFYNPYSELIKSFADNIRILARRRVPTKLP